MEDGHWERRTYCNVMDGGRRSIAAAPTRQLLEGRQCNKYGEVRADRLYFLGDGRRRQEEDGCKGGTNPGKERAVM